MTRRQIQNELTHRNVTFAEYILSLDKSDFSYSFEKRWTAGQQLFHVVKTTEPVLLGLKTPLFILQLLFGKPQRPAMDYTSLVDIYQKILADGGKSPGIYVPANVEYRQAENLKKRLLLAITKINLHLEQLSEEQLDTYRLPHPLLGKLTMREMLYFTMYHVEHHMEKAKANLRYVGIPSK
jgi:hypothetical protein